MQHAPRGLTRQIILATLLGGLAGIVCHSFQPVARHSTEISAILNLLTTLFLRAIKMLIAPLVLATLISGIGRMGNSGSVGRIAAKALLWFIGGALLAMAAGYGVVEILQPGVGLHLKGALASSGIKPTVFDPIVFIQGLIPTSIIDVMARNDVLPIVVFAVFAGLAIARMGEAGKDLLRLTESLSATMLQIATFIMRFSPVAVFAAVAVTFVERGAGVLSSYASYLGAYYLSLAVIWIVMIVAGALALGKGSLWDLLRQVRQPGLVALTTTSSEAAYPALLQKLEDFGVPNKIASFVLPLGYSFNLIGSMCYCTFAVLFIAQACDVTLTGMQIAQLLLLLFITSKGIANVPRAALVVVATAAPYFNLPEVGIAFVLAVDHLLDMGRTATNVVANAIVATAVAKWEDQTVELGSPAWRDTSAQPLSAP
jgi:Na+/H+-dicarboxylate symporter